MNWERFTGPLTPKTAIINQPQAVKELIVRFGAWNDFASIDDSVPMFFSFETHPTHWVIFSRSKMKAGDLDWLAEFIPKESLTKTDWLTLVHHRAEDIGAKVPDEG